MRHHFIKIILRIIRPCLLAHIHRNWLSDTLRGKCLLEKTLEPLALTVYFTLFCPVCAHLTLSLSHTLLHTHTFTTCSYMHSHIYSLTSAHSYSDSYLYTHMHIRTSTFVQASTMKHAHTHTFTHMHTPMHMGTQLFTFKHMHTLEPFSNSHSCSH